MSQRLPTPGGDSGTWGDVLNNFLEVSHNSDGTLVPNAVSIAGAEMTANKGVANGYAPLNGSSQVPFINLPIGTTSGTVAAGNDTRITGAMQVGSAAGADLIGNYPNPTVAKLNGISTPSIAPTVSGQVLTSISTSATAWQIPSAAYQPWQFQPESYGAKGDGKVISDAVISGGSMSTLTSSSASFTIADTGKYVMVHNAGLATGSNGVFYPLVTTITYVSATTVTLATAATNSVSGQFAVYGTDDTAAIQAAVNAASAYGIANNYYAEVLVRPHTYIVAGSLVQGGATKGNAQITLPVVPISGNPPLVLNFVGTRSNAGVGMFTANGDNPAPEWQGTAFVSILLGQSWSSTYGGPSVIGGPTSVQGYSGGFTNQWNNLVVVVNGLSILCPVKPTVTAMDLRTCIRAEVTWFRSLVFAPESSISNWDPTPQGTAGLVMPQTGNNAHNFIGSYGCEGFGYGVIISEHTTFQEITVVLCGYGLYILGGGGHGITGLLLNAEANGTHIQSDGQQSSLNVVSMSTEGLIGGWGSGYYFDDPGNNLFGRVGIGGLVFSAITRNGATNLEIIGDINQSRGAQTAPSIPANGVALTNPFWRHAAVYITSGGGAVTSIAVGGTPTGITLGISGTVIVRVPSGMTITMTYASTAPSWTWVVD